jgi:hypothetical protein
MKQQVVMEQYKIKQSSLENIQDTTRKNVTYKEILFKE